MAHLIEILTALFLGGSVVGGGFRAMAKLTRLVDAIEHLSASMEHVVGQIGDHENRLTRLEDAHLAAARRTRATTASWPK